MEKESVFFINIADIIIKIIDNNPVSKAIIQDLGAQLTSKTNNEYHILIDINKNNIKGYQAEVFSAKGNMNFNRSAYFVNYINELNYLVEHLFDSEPINIKVNVSKKSIKKRIKQTLGNKIVIEKNVILSYALFWYILHYELIKNHKSFIHAGIFELNNHATIISGTGGCGKTSTLFKILEDTSTKYISEDFGIIDSDGFCYYNPKPVSIYASDMEFGQSILKNYFNRFKLLEKLTWKFKRNLLKANPMIKVSPHQLMNERIEKKSRVKHILYFIRDNSTNLKIESIDTEQLAERVLDSSMRELKSLNDLLLSMRANAPLEYNIPSFEKIRKQTKEVYLKSFSNTQNEIVYIPHKTAPIELVTFLKKNELL